MATWGFDDNYTKISSERVKTANRQKSTAGYNQSFSKATVGKWEFTTEISYLTLAQRDTIQEFFDDNQGEGFTFKDPDPFSTTTYTVIFGQDTLKFDYVNVFPDPQYKVSIIFLEV